MFNSYLYLILKLKPVVQYDLDFVSNVALQNPEHAFSIYTAFVSL